MNRNLTIIFIELDNDIISEILKCLESSLSSSNFSWLNLENEFVDYEKYEDIQIAPTTTTSYDTIYEWSIDIIKINMIHKDFEDALKQILIECKRGQRMLNIFTQIHKNISKEIKEEYDKNTWKKLEKLVEFTNNYVTSNSHLFFF